MSLSFEFYYFKNFLGSLEIIFPRQSSTYLAIEVIIACIFFELLIIDKEHENILTRTMGIKIRNLLGIGIKMIVC